MHNNVEADGHVVTCILIFMDARLLNNYMKNLPYLLQNKVIYIKG